MSAGTRCAPTAGSRSEWLFAQDIAVRSTAIKLVSALITGLTGPSVHSEKQPLMRRLKPRLLVLGKILSHGGFLDFWLSVLVKCAAV